MSYPKPLSEKSLERLYTQAGLSTEVCDFLHSLFAACANLYGAIALRDVWSVYQKLKSGAPRIHRRDLYALRQVAELSHLLGDIAARDADGRSARNIALYNQFIDNLFGRIDGDSKPDTFDTGNSDLRRIDTYNLPFRIDQRTAGIAGIDRRISLDQVKFTFP